MCIFEESWLNVICASLLIDEDVGKAGVFRQSGLSISFNFIPQENDA